MKTLEETIRSRQSIRSYDPGKPLTPETLMQILEAGRMAPSAVNFQPWTFVVVQTDSVLNAVKSSYPRAWFADAPQVLVLVGNTDRSWKRVDGYNSIETDLAIAMDHIILAAHSLGVATCWVANFDDAKLRQALDLSVGEVVFAMTPLGYPKDDFKPSTAKNRKELNEIVRFI